MDLQSTFEEITDNLHSLGHIVENSSPRFSCASFIAPTLREDENLPVTQVTPESKYGREAMELTVKSWKDLHIRDDFSQKSVRRTAGVLWYQPDNSPEQAEIIRLIDTINKGKSAIERYLIDNYATSAIRFQVLHDACPRVMTLHIYRQIRYWTDANIAAVRFCWQEKESLLAPDKAALLLRMGRDGDTDDSTATDLLFKKVLSVPDDRLRIRRRLPVQPVANVTFQKGESGPAPIKTVTAPMPYIIFQHQRPDFKLLDPYVSAQRKGRKPRSDRVATEVIGTFRGESIEMIL